MPPAYTSPPTWTTSQVVNAADLNTNLRDMMLYFGGTGGFVAAQVYHSTTQTVAHNSNTALVFNSEVTDPEGFHSVSSNPSRLTVPTGHGGLYLAIAIARFQANATGARSLALAVNGIGFASNTVLNLGAAYPTSVLVAGTYVLNAGEYVEAFANQDSGSTLNIDNGTTFMDPGLVLIKV